MNFWQHPNWIKVKTQTFKTDKLMSRVEYLKYIGAKEYSEEKYQAYLKIMTQTENELK